MLEGALRAKGWLRKQQQERGAEHELLRKIQPGAALPRSSWGGLGTHASVRCYPQHLRESPASLACEAARGGAWAGEGHAAAERRRRRLAGQRGRVRATEGGCAGQRVVLGWDFKVTKGGM